MESWRGVLQCCAKALSSVLGRGRWELGYFKAVYKEVGKVGFDCCTALNQCH